MHNYYVDQRRRRHEQLYIICALWNTVDKVVQEPANCIYTFSESGAKSCCPIMRSVSIVCSPFCMCLYASLCERMF